MEEAAGWIAPIATMVAAVMTAANLGARITGWGFIVFTVGSICWSIVAIATGQQNLLWTNGFLTLVNAIGIWRWLGRQRRYDEGGEEAAERSAAKARVPNLFAIGSIAGAGLHGRDGIRIGTVVGGMMDGATMRLAYLVVSEGGVGGVGERLHALSRRDMDFDGDGLSCRLSAAELQRRPILDPQSWPASLDELTETPDPVL